MKANLHVLSIICLLFFTSAFAREINPQQNCAVTLENAGPITTQRAVEALQTFAQENNLPMNWMTFGPPDRPIRRLIVGVDYNDRTLVLKYMQRFNLDTPLGDGAAGTLALELGAESQAGDTKYVGGVLRTSGYRTGDTYRYGRLDQIWDVIDDQVFGTTNPQKGIRFYSHLIGLSPAEQANVRFYLDHPKMRAPVKSTNCLAWVSNIELGRTCENATAEERKHLFSELGMSRSSAHYEIGRRLFHAANERHQAIAVFYEGEKGLAAFNEIEKHVPPTPLAPYSSILKNYAGLEAAEEAVASIPDGAKVFVPLAAGASPEGIAALMKRAAAGEKGMDIHILVNGVSEAVLRAGIAAAPDKVRVHALFLGGNARALHSDGLISVIPGYLGDFNRWVASPDHPEFHYDAILLRVAPPVDGSEVVSLGPNQDMIMSILRARPGIKIVAEVNPNVPTTTGNNQIPVQRITASFKSDSKLSGPTTVPMSDIDVHVGENIAQLVPSGVTLQIGIGNVFAGIPDALQALGRSNIQIYTEMFSDPMMEMIENGTSPSAQTSFAFGSEAMYRWLNGNPRVKFIDTEVSNDPAKIKDTPQFHAVNTALQVDLRGEINATHGPNGRLSSPGGQVEFMSGASKSAGGKAIIAIRSTVKDETISTISATLYGPVTTPAEMVTHVVTEYGIATLAGKSEAERAMALIRIAHPKFRAQLVNDAQNQKLLTSAQAQKFREELGLL